MNTKPNEELERQFLHAKQTIRNIKMVASSKGSASWEDTLDGSKVYNQAYVDERVAEAERRAVEETETKMTKLLTRSGGRGNTYGAGL